VSLLDAARDPYAVPNHLAGDKNTLPKGRAHDHPESKASSVLRAVPMRRWDSLASIGTLALAAATWRLAFFTRKAVDRSSEQIELSRSELGILERQTNAVQAQADAVATESRQCGSKHSRPNARTESRLPQLRRGSDPAFCLSRRAATHPTAVLAGRSGQVGAPRAVTAEPCG
jgi:hypothetical protein